MSLTMRSSKCTLHTPASSASMFPVQNERTHTNEREQSVCRLSELLVPSSGISAAGEFSCVNTNRNNLDICPALGARTTIGVQEPESNGLNLQSTSGHCRHIGSTPEFILEEAKPSHARPLFETYVAHSDTKRRRGRSKDYKLVARGTAPPKNKGTTFRLRYFTHPSPRPFGPRRPGRRDSC